jgi:hypothetical protein
MRVGGHKRELAFSFSFDRDLSVLYMYSLTEI